MLDDKTNQLRNSIIDKGRMKKIFSLLTNPHKIDFNKKLEELICCIE
jgi:hypothetical protein